MRKRYDALKQEMTLAAESFERQADIQKKFAEEATDEFNRGWHHGIGSAYYDAMVTIQGWVLGLQDGDMKAVRTGVSSVVILYQQKTLKQSNPTQEQFSRGYISAVAVKSQELLLLLKNWQLRIGAR